MTLSPSAIIGIPACIAPRQYHNHGLVTITLREFPTFIFPEISSGERRQARGQTAPVSRKERFRTGLIWLTKNKPYLFVRLGIFRHRF
jgi:hypothetical protein